MLSNQASVHPQVKTKNRLVSLDALRGFDMFWIIGARAIAVGLVGLNLPGVAAVTTQLYHTKWNGFTFYDLIFPLFIFITGVSLVLALRKRLERGDSRMSIFRHVLTRAVILFLLGIVYNGFDSGGPLLNSIRVMGVLQRNALCYFFASMLVIYTKPRTQAITALGILAGYWAVMRFVPVPGFGPGTWTGEGNLVHYIDSLLVPGRLDFDTWDSEGLLSTIPAIGTCLLGVLSAHWLRTDKWRGQLLHAERRALYLFLAGLVLAVLGLLVNPYFPINKKLWTSSFVLLTGGLSVMLLAVFHWVIDLRGSRRWSFPFVVLGMNSIFIYLAARFVPFEKIVDLILGGNLFTFLGRGQDLVAGLTQLSIEGLVVWWLYNRKTFIRL